MTTVRSVPISMMGIFVFLFILVANLYSQIPSPSPIVVQVQPPHKDIADYLVAGVQVAALIGLIVYVIKTWEIASATRRSTELSQRSLELSQAVLEEMKAARLQESAPYVVVYFDMPYGNDWVMYFVVKNTGRTVAKDVKLTFDPPLMTGFGDNPHAFDIYAIKEGIRLLAPGQEIRTPFDSHPNYVKDKLPTIYQVAVSYSDGIRPDRIVHHDTIDLSIFDDLSVLQKKEEEDLIKAVETLARSSERTQGYLRHIAKTLIAGVWLKNPELALDLRREPQAWRRSALAKVNEFEILWTRIYAGHFERPVTLYTEDLQSRLSIIASQLSLIAASAPERIESSLVQSLIDMAIKLTQLSQWQFYMDGGESYRKFNAAGDELLPTVNDIIATLRLTHNYELDVTNGHENVRSEDGEDQSASKPPPEITDR